MSLQKNNIGYGLLVVIASITVSTIVAASVSNQPVAPPPADALNGNRILEFREINFSTPNQDVHYNSTTSNDPKGMQPLYKIANQLLDFFLGDDVIPAGKLIDFDIHTVVRLKSQVQIQSSTE